MITNHLKNGYVAGCFNPAPIYPGATWHNVVPVFISENSGLVFKANFSFRDEKIFNLEVKSEKNGSKILLYLTATKEQTKTIKNYSSLDAVLYVEDEDGGLYLLTKSKIFIDDDGVVN